MGIPPEPRWAVGMPIGIECREIVRLKVGLSQWDYLVHCGSHPNKITHNISIFLTKHEIEPTTGQGAATFSLPTRNHSRKRRCAARPARNSDFIIRYMSALTPHF
jgi:hypothetical protein